MWNRIGRKFALGSAFAAAVVAMFLPGVERFRPALQGLPDAADELLDAACLGDVPRMRRALARTHTAEVRNAVGATPLCCAALYGRRDAARWLIASGADVNAVAEGGFTPLMFAAIGGDDAMVQMLLDAGARVDARADGGKLLERRTAQTPAFAMEITKP